MLQQALRTQEELGKAAVSVFIINGNEVLQVGCRRISWERKHYQVLTPLSTISARFS